MSEICVICIEELEVGDSSLTVSPGCGHFFHSECLKGLRSRECPLCRKEMTLPVGLGEIVDTNVREKKREDEVVERTNIATSLISQGATPNLRVQYLAGVATLKKTFNVNEESIPSFETMKVRYENEPSIGVLIATRFIHDTLTSLGRQNDLTSYLDQLPK